LSQHTVKNINFFYFTSAFQLLFTENSLHAR
jgi:hypothetical protein